MDVPWPSSLRHAGRARAAGAVRPRRPAPAAKRRRLRSIECRAAIWPWRYAGCGGISSLVTPFIRFIGEERRHHVAQPLHLGIAMELPVPVLLEVDRRSTQWRPGDA